MNKFIEKNYKTIFLVLLYLQPFIDLLTGLFINILDISITIGIVMRSIFILYIVYTSIFIFKEDLKKKLIYLSVCALYSIIFIIMLLINKDSSVLFYEVSFLIKYLYLPVMLICTHKMHINTRHLINVFIIYIILILLPDVFNININAYTQGKIGDIGLFYSANEISAILSIILPFLIYYTFTKGMIYKLLLLLVIPLFFIGSKSVILALLLCLVIILFVYFYKLNLKKKIIVFIISIIITIMGALLIPTTSFYKNLVLHLEFSDVNNIADLTTYDGINNIIFSQRLTFLENTYNNYKSATVQEKIFGMGYIENYGMINESTKQIEMDIFDIYFRLGIIGFLICLYPLIDILRKVKKVNLKYILSLFIILVLSTIVGHTIVAPSVAIFIVIVFNNLITKEDDLMRKKKILFIASAGGHLNELMQLKPMFSNYDYHLITENLKSNLSLKKEYGKKINYLVFGSKDHKLIYPFKFIYNTIKSLVLYIKIRPNIIITTGTHTAVPMCYIGKMFQSKIIFIETFANQSTKTLSGKMIYPIANLFVVQWEEMLKLYPKAVYGGWIY